ncbi:hypothetical protein [Pseudomonas lini]|uniref:hypothetical protein n=1 Tax=Pseudomonas lini TaxID=163011 RepID=UPI00345F06B0
MRQQRSTLQIQLNTKKPYQDAAYGRRRAPHLIRIDSVLLVCSVYIASMWVNQRRRHDASLIPFVDDLEVARRVELATGKTVKAVAGRGEAGLGQPRNLRHPIY